jgi:hypothetical protein
MKFPLMNVKNGDPYTLIIGLWSLILRRSQGAKVVGSGFRFEANWIQEEGCRKVIEDAWEQRLGTDCSLGECLRGVATSLKDWSVNVLGDLEKRLKKAKKELERWRREPISDDSFRGRRSGASK